MRLKSSKKGMSINVIVGLVIFLAVGLISMLLYFAGTGLFPRMMNTLQDAGIIKINLSVEEPPMFEISPALLDQRRTDILSRGYLYHVSFAGHFDISRGFEWGSFGIAPRTRYFWIDERFNERETPTGELESTPTRQHITPASEKVPEEDIWIIDEVTRGRIRFTYQTDEGSQTIEQSFHPSDGSTRAMIQVPYTLSTGEVIRIDIAEFRYLGLSENERHIRYEIVPSYSQASIQSNQEGDTDEDSE